MNIGKLGFINSSDKLQGFSRASTAAKRDTGQVIAPYRPRYETGWYEQGAVNLLSGKTAFVNTGNSTTGWLAYNGAAVTVTPGQADPAGGTSAYRIQTTGGSSSDKYVTNAASPSVNGQKYSAIVWIRVRGATVRVSTNITNLDIPAGGWTPAPIQSIGNGVSIMQLSFKAVNVGDSLDFDVWHPMVLAGDPAPYTDTSRSAILGSGALLIEESVQNLMPVSDPTALAQLSLASGVTAASGVAPGLAGGAQFGDGSVTRYAYNAVTLAVTTQYCISAFVRMDDGGTPVVGVSTNPGADFDLVVASAGLAAGACSVQNLGGGLYRVSGPYTTQNPVGGAYCGVVKYSGQSARGFKVSGFQLEQRAYPTSYHPTQGAAATRAAESYSVPLAAALPAEWTALVLFKPYWASTQDVSTSAAPMALSLRVDDSNATYLRYDCAVDKFLFYNRVAGVNTTLTPGPTVAWSPDTWIWLAGRHTASGKRLSWKIGTGVPVHNADADVTAFAGSPTFHLATFSGVNYQFDAPFDHCHLLGRALTDAEVEAWMNSDSPPVPEASTILFQKFRRPPQGLNFGL